MESWSFIHLIIHSVFCFFCFSFLKKSTIEMMIQMVIQKVWQNKIFVLFSIELCRKIVAPRNTVYVKWSLQEITLFIAL